nr:hypothetical protein [Tanacetum cinerariifolium]
MRGSSLADSETKNKALRGRGKIAAIDVDEDVTLVDVEKDEEWEHPLLAVRTYTASRNSLLAVGMPCAFYSQQAEKARFLDEHMAKRLHDDEVEQAAAREKQEKDDLEKMQEKHLDNIKKYQTLKRKPISIAQARKNMIVYLKNMAGYKMEHFKGMTYDKVRPIFEREYNKVQTMFKPDKDVEEPQKKRVAEETLLQESIKKLKAVEVLALQVKYPLIDWEIHSEGSRTYWKIIRVGGITQAYQSFKDMLKYFDREDLDALCRLVKEKFSTTVPTVDKEKALWVELKRLFKPDANDVI